MYMYICMIYIYIYTYTYMHILAFVNPPAFVEPAKIPEDIFSCHQASSLRISPIWAAKFMGVQQVLKFTTSHALSFSCTLTWQWKSPNRRRFPEYKMQWLAFGFRSIFLRLSFHPWLTQSISSQTLWLWSSQRKLTLHVHVSNYIGCRSPLGVDQNFDALRNEPNRLIMFEFASTCFCGCAVPQNQFHQFHQFHPSATLVFQDGSKNVWPRKPWDLRICVTSTGGWDTQRVALQGPWGRWGGCWHQGQQRRGPQWTGDNFAGNFWQNLGWISKRFSPIDRIHTSIGP